MQVKVTSLTLPCILYGGKSYVLTSHNKAKMMKSVVQTDFFSAKLSIYFCAVQHRCYMLGITGNYLLGFFYSAFS